MALLLALLGVASPVWAGPGAPVASESLDADVLRDAKRLKAKAVAAWIYGGAAQSTAPSGKRYVAAELDLKRWTPNIELSDIEAVNVSTKAAYGNPQYVCLDAADAWLDCEEAARQGEGTVRLVWTVSDQATALKFTLYGRRLAGKVTIEPSGPSFPRRDG